MDRCLTVSPAEWFPDAFAFSASGDMLFCKFYQHNVDYKCENFTVTYRLKPMWHNKVKKKPVQHALFNEKLT